MQKYVIERDLPGAGDFTQAQLSDVARKSREVLREMGPDIQWIQTFVTDDKLYCLYFASDEARLLEHARRGGFPADSISAVRSVIDMTT